MTPVALYALIAVLVLAVILLAVALFLERRRTNSLGDQAVDLARDNVDRIKETAAAKLEAITAAELAELQTEHDRLETEVLHADDLAGYLRARGAGDD